MDPFDITKAAPAYSSISAVLAGFSFAVLMYIIQSTEKLSEEEGGDADKGLTLIAITFLGNVVIAVLWGMVSGEPSRRMRPEILGFVATIFFATNTPLTFQAVAHLVAGARNPFLVRLFRLTYLFTVMMAAIFVIVNVVYLHAEIQAGPHRTPQPLLVLNSVHGRCLVAFLCLIFFISWIINLIYNQTQAGMPSGSSRKHISPMSLSLRIRDAVKNKKTFSAFTFACLAAGLILVAFFAWVSMGDADTIIPIDWLYALAVFWSLLSGWGFMFTPRPGRDEVPQLGSTQFARETLNSQL